jgi:hypothetical protein
MTFHPIASRSSCVALAFLLAWGTAVARADSAVPISPQAKAHFQAGVEFMRLDTAEGYADAYRELKAAYAASPAWKILGNLGQAADELERDGEAVDALQEYLDKGEHEMSTRKATQLRADLERLRSGLATVTLQAPGPFWVVDTRTRPAGPIVNEYGPFDGRAELRVRAGEHSFELTRTDAVAASWPVTLLAGDTATHSFVIAPEPAKSVPSAAAEPPPARQSDMARQPHTAAYVLWGVGALALGAGAVFYLESRRFQSDANAKFPTACPDGADPDDYECSGVLSNDAKAANLRTAALLTGLGALGALVGGTVLYSLDLRSKPEEGSTDDPAVDAASLRAWFSPMSVGISGRF